MHFQVGYPAIQQQNFMPLNQNAKPAMITPLMALHKKVSDDSKKSLVIEDIQQTSDEEVLPQQELNENQKQRKQKLMKDVCESPVSK